MQDRIEKLIILPTPLSLKSKLPPALTAYKAPMAFMRPKGTFKADLWTASGLAYVINRETADGYQGPYEQDEVRLPVSLQYAALRGTDYAGANADAPAI